MADIVSNYPREADLSQVAITPSHARAALRLAPWLLGWMVIPTLAWSLAAYLGIITMYQPLWEGTLIPWVYLAFLMTAVTSLWFLRRYAKAAAMDRATTKRYVLLFVLGSIPGIGILLAFGLHVQVCLDLQQKGFPPLRGRIPTRALRAIVHQSRQRGEL